MEWTIDKLIGFLKEIPQETLPQELKDFLLKIIETIKESELVNNISIEMVENNILKIKCLNLEKIISAENIPGIKEVLEELGFSQIQVSTLEAAFKVKEKSMLYLKLNGGFTFLNLPFKCEIQPPIGERKGWELHCCLDEKQKVRVKDILKNFGAEESLPDVIVNQEIETLSFQVNTETKEWKFEFAVRLPKEHGEFLLNITLHVVKQDNEYKIITGGTIELGGVTFSLSIDDKSFKAHWKQSASGQLDLRNLLKSVGFPEETLPEDFNASLNKVQLEYEFESKTLFIQCKFELAGIHFECNIIKTGEGWQFSGSSEEGQNIKFGRFLEKLAAIFSLEWILPGPLKEMTIKGVKFSFQTKTGNFAFKCETLFPLEKSHDITTGAGGLNTTVTIDIEKKQDGTGYTKKFKGSFKLNEHTFNLQFDSNPGNNRFAATYALESKKPLINPRTLLKSVISDETVLSLIPDVDIDFKNAYFAFNEKKYIFGFEVSAVLNLSTLPLVGDFLPQDSRLGFKSLKLIVASREINSDEVGAFSDILEQGKVKLIAPKEAIKNTRFRKGTNFNTVLMIGGIPEPVNLPFDNSVPAGARSPDRNKTVTQSPDGTLWVKIQKNLGPVYFERIGVLYRDGGIYFPLDASLSIKVVTISFHGLAFGFPLSALSDMNTFTLLMDLKGMGLNIKRPPVFQIGADFLRTTVTDEKTDETYDEYLGSGIFEFGAIGISLMGIYAHRKDDPSLFMYARVSIPLGGPPFFFVTGLSGGFGYNRALIAPDIRDVGVFPLVTDAINGDSIPAPGEEARNFVSNKLEALKEHITVQTGQYFIAGGITFSVCALIDGFALLVLNLGERFSIDFLGFASMKLPPQLGSIMDPLVSVELAIKGQFNPSDGVLSFEGMLTEASYLLTNSCRLHGGFAFYLWFSGPNAGDFVYTMGGYHPSFKLPDHYPRVPRVGATIDLGVVSIKCELYFAITGRAIMAGGLLQGTFDIGLLKAWFKTDAHFLISWEPFFIDAGVMAQVGGAIGWLKAELSAEIRLWGPSFGGKVGFTILFIDINVQFGASHPGNKPDPIDWEKFKKRFLAQQDSICSLSASKGLLKTVNEGTGKEPNERWVLNPNDFTLTTRSSIPVQKLHKDSRCLEPQSSTCPEFSVAPMGGKKKVEDLKTRQKISIDRIVNNAPIDAKEDFSVTPVLQHFPSALWGHKFITASSDMNGPRQVNDLISGYTIKARNLPAPGQSKSVLQKKLGIQLHLNESASQWHSIQAYAAEKTLAGQTPGKAKKRLNEIESSIVNTHNKRKELAMAMGLNADAIDEKPFNKDDYIRAPGIGRRITA